MSVRYRKLSVAALLLSAILLVGGQLRAQTSPPSHQEGMPSAEEVQSNSGPDDQSKDDTAQFKRSASVRYFATITHLGLDQAYWLIVVVNFVIVVALIPWVIKALAGSNVSTLFRNRTASIQKSLAEARAASEDANRRLSAIESRLGRLDQEIEEMRATAEKEAAAEEERIKAAAEEDARRIVESAQQEISAMTRAARRDLMAYAADLAVSLAAKQIRVDTTTDQGLVRQFVRQLPDGNAPEKKN